MHFPEVTPHEGGGMQFKPKSLVSNPGLCCWIGINVSFQPCSLLILVFPLGTGVDCLILVFLSDKWALNAR